MKIFTPDPDNIDVPGSGPFKFTNKARWWFLWKYAKQHDDAYEALKLGGTFTFSDGFTASTFEQADYWYTSRTKHYVLSEKEFLTPAQKRFALIATGLTVPAFAIWEMLTR